MKKTFQLLIIAGLFMANLACSSSGKENQKDNEASGPAATEDLVAWYPFDGDLEDRSQSNFHAENVNAVWTSDRFNMENMALEFNGSSSGILLDERFPEVLTGSFTLTMWVYFEDDSRAVLLGSYNAANNVNFEKHTNNRLRIFWNNGEKDFFTPDNVMSTNKWHLVTFIRDKEQDMFSIGVDGKEVAKMIGSGTDIAPTGPFYIGRDSREGSTVTYGKIDDVRISNKVLSLEEYKQASVNQGFYIVNITAVKTENEAKTQSAALEYEDFATGYLWIPDFLSLSGAEFYSVYFGPFSSQHECELAVEEIRNKYPDSYGLQVSQYLTRVQINGVGKIKETRYTPGPETGLKIVHDESMGHMKSKIYLTIGNKQVFIAEVFGFAEMGGGDPLPEGTLASCRSMYTGAGTFICVAPSENGIMVYKGWSEEPSGEYDGNIGPNWEEFKELLYSPPDEEQ